MQPMAKRLGVDHQQLQQFLTSSTWDVAGVRRRLATAAVDVVAPQVWVVDNTGFPKDGKAPACVARSTPEPSARSPTARSPFTVHAATDPASAVLNWRLFVPESWDDTCVPGPDGKPANAHARRLRQQPVTLDQDGAKKPHSRVRLPPAEQIEQIRRRRAASKVPDTRGVLPQMTLTGHREHALPIRAEHHQTGTLMDVQPGARYPTERPNDPTVGDPTTGIQRRHPIDHGAGTRRRKIRKRQRPTTKTPPDRPPDVPRPASTTGGSDHNVSHADHPHPKRDRPTSTRRSDWCGQACLTTSTS